MASNYFFRAGTFQARHLETQLIIQWGLFVAARHSVTFNLKYKQRVSLNAYFCRILA